MLGLDGYSFRARWLPCVLIGTPAMLATASWLPSVAWSLLTAAPLLAAIAVALSQLARNKGRDLQTRLWREWGGAPTTYVLRNGSERISPESLQRYRRFIAQLVTDVSLPTPEQERAAAPGAFAGVYSAVTTALINRTRDKQKFPHLYGENVSYGYWRNLLGLRSIAIWLAALAFIVAAARVTTTALAASARVTPAMRSWATAQAAGGEPGAGRTEADTLMERGALAVVAMLASGIFLAFFRFKLSDELVRRAGFNYADRLVEASEQLVSEERPK